METTEPLELEDAIEEEVTEVKRRRRPRRQRGGGGGGSSNSNSSNNLQADAEPVAEEPEEEEDEGSLRIDRVVEPKSGAHSKTMIVLPGFKCSAGSVVREWGEELGSYDGLRLVFLEPPVREISCYGPRKPRKIAWHDYLTDFGGGSGAPNLEERIDLDQLAEMRRQIHRVITVEGALLKGKFGSVLLFGESQGGCVALDAALTYPKKLAGVFSSFGMLYSNTTLPFLGVDDVGLRVAQFHGAADATIGPGLALRSLARLLEAGFTEVTVHLAPGLSHCETESGQLRFLRETLRTWGLKRAKLGLTGRGEVAKASRMEARTSAVAHLKQTVACCTCTETDPAAFSSRQLSKKNTARRCGQCIAADAAKRAQLKADALLASESTEKEEE